MIFLKNKPLIYYLSAKRSHIGWNFPLIMSYEKVYETYNNFTPCEWRSGRYTGISLSVHLSVRLCLQIRVRPVTIFCFNINMGLSTWHIVLHTFKIPIWLSPGKIYSVWHGFVLVPQFVLSFEIVIPYIAHECIM